MQAANDASSVVEQMSAEIQQIAANANEVAVQSGQAVDKAEQGKELMILAKNLQDSLRRTTGFYRRNCFLQSST